MILSSVMPTSALAGVPTPLYLAMSGSAHRRPDHDELPHIAHPLPVRQAHKIAEIVAGPAAPLDTERTLRTILRLTGISADFSPVFVDK